MSRAARVSAADRKQGSGGRRWIVVLSSVIAIGGVTFVALQPKLSIENRPRIDGERDQARLSASSEASSEAPSESAEPDAMVADSGAGTATSTSRDGAGGDRGPAGDDALALRESDPAGNDEATSEDAAVTPSSSTSTSAAMTPGLSSLQSLAAPAPLPLPPDPVLPGVGEPAHAARPTGRGTGVDRPDEGSAIAAVEAETVGSEVLADCPLDDGAGPIVHFVPFEPETAAPSPGALEQARAFGASALRCEEAEIRAIGFALDGENALDNAIASLRQARLLLELLEDAGVDTASFEAFSSALPAPGGEDRIGVEIRVN